MKVTIAMIVLNEAEFIEKNLKQHYVWEGSDVHQIIIVEGSVELYPKRNITPQGLSTDKTAEIINNFPDPENKIEFIQGMWKDKSHQRNQYAKRVSDNTDYLIVIDCDEFYTKNNQRKISEFLKSDKKKHHSILFPQVHLWKSFKNQVVGGYWAVPHLRLYRWHLGCHYGSNHNELISLPGHNYHIRDDEFIETRDFCCIHFGFFRSDIFVRDKQDYYYNRGEKATRPMYSDCREMSFNWKEGYVLPHGSKVILYEGEILEVFE